ncbi:MAG TPA: PSD1 and planctomycete cytochrome C domain-containing protein, partial [Tepidisphaeraceae bacterium]|nr:PSD1 and planctomycete cytochrome C domain-containing protein [Tepidisphaeraceae bacterium]
MVVRLVCLTAMLGCVANASGQALKAADLEFFESRVRPVLVDHCYKCHSASAEKLKGGLHLDSRDGVLKGGDDGPVIVPGNPGQSRLIEAVHYTNKDLQMPPKDRLSAQQVADLEKWVAMGAPDPRVGAAPVAKKGIDIEQGRKWWAFQPLKVEQPPKVKDESWVRTDVDRFVLAQQQEKGLRPNAAASRQKLIRRAYFDLVGLPPSPQEVQQFVEDESPDAYSKLIDRLLASPHFGERWARHWLDVARFAESDGFEHDSDRPAAYQYRDFVIRAMNQDMPFDQFVKWQIAGDEFAPHDWQAMAATGFLTAGVFPTQITEREFETTRYNQLDDMVTTTGNAMLGLTVGCARCHDHKFDPIPTEDYYRLTAAFTTAIRSDVDIDLTTPAERETFAKEHAAKVSAARARVQPFEKWGLPDWFLVTLPQYRQLERALVRAEATPIRKRAEKTQVTSEGLPPVKGFADGRGYPHFYKQVYLLRRGDPNNKVEPVSESFLQVLMRKGTDASHWQTKPPPGSRTSYRRRALANWLTDADSGAGQLLARVIVNRLWQHHLGRGIVSTPNDFGVQGEPPTNPQLLDWLADDLIRHGWQLKRLHKLIMTSSVYMQDSQTSPDREAIDPHDVYLWRWQPRRLEAEPIRDAM